MGSQTWHGGSLGWGRGGQGARCLGCFAVRLPDDAGAPQPGASARFFSPTTFMFVRFTYSPESWTVSAQSVLGPFHRAGERAFGSDWALKPSCPRSEPSTGRVT